MFEKEALLLCATTRLYLAVFPPIFVLVSVLETCLFLGNENTGGIPSFKCQKRCILKLNFCF